MRHKRFRMLFGLGIVACVFCSSMFVHAVPAYKDEQDYASSAVVIRDRSPYAVSQEYLEIIERDYVSSHTYYIDTTLGDSATYYLSGKIKLDKANTLSIEPAFTVRKGVSIQFNGSNVKVCSNGKPFDENSIFDFNFEINKEYSFVIKSTVSQVSLWVGGRAVIENYALPYEYCGRVPDISITFSKSSGYCKNIHIWSNTQSEPKEQMHYSSDINPVNDSAKDTVNKIDDLRRSYLLKNVWIAYVSAFLAIITVGLVVLYIINKQRRLKRENQDN